MDVLSLNFVILWISVMINAYLPMLIINYSRNWDNYRILRKIIIKWGLFTTQKSGTLYQLIIFILKGFEIISYNTNVY